MSRMFSTQFALCWMLAAAAVPAFAAPVQDGAHAAAAREVRVTGIVRDEQNATPLPGVAVALVGTDRVVHTDLDGRYAIDVPEGSQQLRIVMDGYQERSVRIAPTPERTLTVDVPLPLHRYAEEVTVTGSTIEAASSTQEAQLVQRRNAQVITDNMGSQEMRSNGDSDAAAALQRVTGLSVVDGQFVFVRGLGERYSNTTLGGAVIPTTEPDKKVVPLDLFPTGLIDSIQVAKSYTPDRPADFAGGLVEIVPHKMAHRQTLDGSIGMNWYQGATGEQIPLSPLGRRDRWGFDGGTRGLPGGFPADKVVRRGIFSPEIGYAPDQITAIGQLLDTSVWRPQARSGRPGQTVSLSYGNRFDRLGVLASLTQTYRENYIEENRRFYRLADDNELEAVTDYDFRTGTQRAQLGVVGNLAYEFDSANRIAFENFYTHSGRDEGRIFEGLNTENNFVYRNYRLQFVEEGLMTNRVTGEHFRQEWANSRIDWRAGYGRATRDEPDLRETLYQQPVVNGTGVGDFVLADESQSGFRLFNRLDDDTLDLAVNWSTFTTLGGRPAVYKFGQSYVRRTRDFGSRRFRYIPTNHGSLNLTQHPELLFATANIGPAYRFNEETRPVDAYDAEMSTVGLYAMTDWVVSNKARLIGGLRVERFQQDVNTFDPFGLFEQRIQASIKNTDLFPAINLVYSVRHNTNLRLGYSQTVNRPEFRELAAFEFTDVVGNRAVRGNPALVRSLIQNFDARIEAFTGGRGVLAASLFFKNFNGPIERVISAGAQPLQTFENAETARNLGVELEAGRRLSEHFYVSLNYTFVDSEITLTDSARRVQTSRSRPLAGQSANLVNAVGEVSLGSFQGRVLYNFFGDRISDVGANDAPDIVEQGRGSLDVVLLQKFGALGLRATLENLTSTPYRFTQGSQDQRRYDLGRAVMFSLGYSLF